MDRSRGIGTSRRPLRSLHAPLVERAAAVGAALEVIVRELARELEAEFAFVAIANQAAEGVKVLAAQGAAAGPDGLPTSLKADGFVGRALAFERAALEPIDRDDPNFGRAGAATPAREMLAAPCTPSGGRAGLLCVAFQGEPTLGRARTLRLAQSYARLAAVGLQEPEVLGRLLVNGRIDGLTGCLTQAAFVEGLVGELARAARSRQPVSCIFIDLDNFKRINDRYGHLHGSRTLAILAGGLRAELRSADSIGRYGGDEFVVLLPDTAEADAILLAQRLHRAVMTAEINLPHDPLDASMGVAQSHPGSHGDALLAAADRALLAAKMAGGGAVIPASTLVSSPVSPIELASADEMGKPPVLSATVSMCDVLEALGQFDSCGGASVELTAWELNADREFIANCYSDALREGLIVSAGADGASGEMLWRLTDHGRTALESSAQTG